MTSLISATSVAEHAVVQFPQNFRALPAVQTVLDNWTPHDWPALETAAFAIGKIASQHDYPLSKAFFVVTQAADERLYDSNFSPPDVTDCIDIYLEKGFVSAPVANDNKPAKERFQITWFDHVDQASTKEVLLEGVLGVGEFSLFVGKPGTAKSALLCDLGLHIAAGIEWHGRQVRQGLVVFFAAERKKLTERRIAAWRTKYGLKNVPFVIVGGKLDMTTGLVDAKALAATIQELEAKSNFKCVLIIIDTVTRTFGPGDQHQSKDMTRYIQSVDELSRAISAHVAAIHHSPWSDDRGKGAIDLDGAIDISFVIKVKGDGPNKIFTLVCTGANDADEGTITSFRLESVPVGTDAKGNVTSAPVVVAVGAEVTPKSGPKGHNAKALASLVRAIAVSIQEPSMGSPAIPTGV